MNKIIMLLAAILLLVSCKPTEYTARKKLLSVKTYYPELLYEECNGLIECITDSVVRVIDTAKWANGEDYTAKIDSLLNELNKPLPELDPKDTCATKLQPYINRIANLTAQIKDFKERYKPCDSSMLVTIYEQVIKESNALYRTEQEAHKKTKVERDEAKGTTSTLWKVVIGMGIILLIGIIVGVVKMFKR